MWLCEVEWLCEMVGVVMGVVVWLHEVENLNGVWNVVADVGSYGVQVTALEVITALL